MIVRHSCFRFLRQAVRNFSVIDEPGKSFNEVSDRTDNSNSIPADRKKQVPKKDMGAAPVRSEKNLDTSDAAEGTKLSVDMIKRTRFLEFAVSSDLYRIDVGFLLARPPLIDDVTDVEMQRRILSHKLKKKNNLYPQIDASLYDFNMKDPMEDIKMKDPMYRMTHEKKEQDGRFTAYHEYSRDIKHLDMVDKSLTEIQVYPKHTVYLLVQQEDGTWTFPNKTLEHDMYLRLSMESLRNKILGYECSTVMVDSFPSFCWYESISAEEIKENRLLQKVKGRKIFFYRLMYNTGSFSHNLLKNYKAYHWVPKQKLQEYISKENYDRMIKCLIH